MLRLNATFQMDTRTNTGFAHECLSGKPRLFVVGGVLGSGIVAGGSGHDVLVRVYRDT